MYTAPEAPTPAALWGQAEGALLGRDLSGDLSVDAAPVRKGERLFDA